MSDTLPQIKLTPTKYTNIYATAGIPLGTPLILQSNSTLPIRVFVGAFQPLPDTDRHFVLLDDVYSTVDIPPNERGCWVLGQGHIIVQSDNKFIPADYSDTLSEIANSLANTVKEIQLLNIRVEEAFNTKIHMHDIQEY